MKTLQKASGYQRGMALIVGLIMLLSLTLLGLAAIQNTNLEERMAGNLRSQNIALQAAESALRAGEGWLASQPTQPNATDAGSTGVWLFSYPFNKCPTSACDPKIDDRFAEWAFWWLGWGSTEWLTYARPVTAGLVYATVGSSTIQTLSSSTGNDRRPYYVVEEDRLKKDTVVIGQSQDFSGRWFYDVTGRGVDEGGRAEVMLRTGYARRY